MGEAKQRKLRDPNYGKPSKMRGLVISCPLILDGSTIVEARPLDMQDLRSSLMYWDRLCLPTNNIVGFDVSNEEKYLKDVGILYDSRFELTGNIIMEEMFSNIQAHTLLEYEKQEPGAWSISGGANSITSIKKPKENGVLLQLLNCVPVPSENVPLAEILEFKAKRRDELLRFREHFETLTAQISNAPDHITELQKTISEVDTACADLIKTTREWQFPAKLTNAHASLNLDISKAVGSAAAAYDLLAKTPLALSATGSAIAAGGAAILSQFKVGGDFSLQKLKRPTSPYKYAYFIQRDLR
ncbi:DUF6236 family protein [Pseudomonas mosselii]|uniref:DUF6236 family protein n=1 Tax=Pseudomonas mosselii TaxID=78327 RepID=A0AA42RSL2_9PSED|nr:DUF6236 family protein [Pseudomonas mosselii]MDH1629273.1 DUF6236 family protein [Pseudomonas mosselii]